MSKPTTTQVHRDAALTNFSISIDRAEFIADKVFPQLTVSKESDQYPTWSQADLLRNEMERRAPGTRGAIAEQGLSWSTYRTVQWALSADIPDETARNADAVLDVRKAKVRMLKYKSLLSREIGFASTFFTSGVWDSDAAVTPGADQWNNYATSSPLPDIETRRQAMRSAVGFSPNVGILGDAAWSKLKFHPDLLNGIKNLGRGVATVADLANLTGIQTWYIGTAIYNTSAEGVSSPVKADVWGKSMLLLYVEPTVGVEVATAGVTFSLRNEMDFIRRWYDDECEKEVVQIKSSYQQAATAASLGRFLGTVVA